MKNLVFTISLLITTSLAAFFGFQYYEVKTAAELAGHQAAVDQAETSRRLTEAENQAQWVMAASTQDLLRARQQAAAAEAQLAGVRVELAASEEAARAAAADADRAEAEGARMLAEAKKISADSLQMARQQAEQEVAAASARLDTVLQLLELEKQRAAAAEKAATDNSLQANQREAQLEQTRQALAKALARLSPANP